MIWTSLCKDAPAPGRLTRFFLVVLGVVVLLGAGSCRRRGASQQEQVVLYCSADQAVAEPVIAQFEKHSGIRVLARFDTEATKTAGLVQRIRAEASRPMCDVFWSSEVFHTIRLTGEGLLDSYSGEQVNDWPAHLHDPQGRWYGFGMRGRVIAYNTQAVEEGEAPRRLEDVLDSRWKGRVVMARPEFGTTSGDVASWFVHYGDARAREILEGLRANEIRLVDGNSTAVRMVAGGQADACFTDTDDVYAGIRNGWPIGMNFLDQGGDGALVIPNTAAIIKGGPNPKNARVLMEFLLSEELEEMLVLSDSHNSPVHEAVAARYKEYAIDRPLEIDYQQVAEKLPTAIQQAREILR